ncbi:MAG TPA: IS21 family transposase [Thermoleophilaceae bacterium]|nr:IS21 family transposase [Thermoleophilaceae bacterium]
MVGVEQWAEIRRMHFVAGVSIKEIARRTGRDRNTIRRALRSQEPPRYRRAERPSKLEPFREEIHRLLGEDGELPGQVIRERLQELGYAGGKTILDDYLREIRPIVSPPRTFQRTVYRPAQTCQFDLWEPSNKVPVGAVEYRRGWVVVACLGYSRAGAGALIFSKQTPDLLWGIARCLWQLGGLPRTLVWDRQAGLCTPGGQPTEEFAALCGRLRVGWHFCRRRDPQAKGAVERLQGYLETNFEPGRQFANERDYQAQLDAWFVKANARTHRTLRCRPVDRLLAEREAMQALPGFPDLDRRWVTRVPADPYLRFDTCDYSLDPRLAGRRVEVRVSQTEVTAVALDSGELACRHTRSFGRYRAITALEHARALRELRGQPAEPAAVETRPLERYDALIA